MAVTMKDFGIDNLSIDDRLTLAGEIWDSIAADPQRVPISDAQKCLVDRRIAELDANPGNVLTWEQIKRHVRGEP